MITRPAAAADRPAITALQRRWDTSWLGAPENDASEVAEELERVQPLAAYSRLGLDGDLVVAAAWWWGNSGTLLVDPAVAATPWHRDLLAWFEEQQAPYVDALATDAALAAVLAERGWTHAHSAFELIRPVSPAWVLAEPRWPEGVDVGDLRPDDAATVHDLIYRDAGWADTRGHEDRGFDDWRRLFLTDTTVPDHQVLAWRAHRLVGVALGRTFSDGTGWVTQLAVAADERGRGLGRALLLEFLQRRRAAGSPALGLAVQTDNRGALALYLDIGLMIDREWQTYRAPMKAG